MTPREALIGYLNTSFPTQMFEEYTDDDGNLRSRPVIDSKGNPVQSKEAVRQRDALIAEVNQMSIPDGPLEMLFDAFGPEAVAENTGRSRRVVPKKQACMHFSIAGLAEVVNQGGALFNLLVTQPQSRAAILKAERKSVIRRENHGVLPLLSGKGFPQVSPEGCAFKG